MKLSRTGAKFSKSRGSSESVSNEILFQCSQLKRHAAGIYGFGHFLVKARNKLIEIIRNNLENFGCAEISLPILQPELLWKNSGRFETFTENKQMFTLAGRNGAYCLAPTGEEIVLDFAKKNINSYKDLPINIFQIGNKYRDELRVRGGLLRSKEFLMKDGYSFHATFDDMVQEYELMKKCYEKIFSELELKTIVVKAVNSDMGGKISEEFMTPSKTGEDKILINVKKNLALNTEVLENENLLKNIQNKMNDFSLNDFKEISCIELAHIFQLGTFYSEKMNGLFTDSDGLKKPYFMGCYGIGINRVLGAICEINYDENGLKWPKAIAPYKVAVLYSNNLKEEAIKIYNFLLDNKIETVLFDSDDGFGSQIKNAKLLGLPFALIVGKCFNENRKVEIENRIDNSKTFLNPSDIVNYFAIH